MKLVNFLFGSETGYGKSLLLLAARRPGRQRQGISIGLPIQLTTYCSVISPSYTHTCTDAHTNAQGEVGTLLNGYVRICQFARPQSGTHL